MSYSSDFYDQTFLNLNNYRDYTFKTDGQQTDLTRGFNQIEYNNREVVRNVAISKILQPLYACRSTQVPNVLADEVIYNTDFNQNLVFAGRRGK